LKFEYEAAKIKLKFPFKKNPTVGKAVSCAQIGQKHNHQRIKSPLTNKSVFDNRIPVVSDQYTFPKVGLQPNPANNTLSLHFQL